MRLSLTKTALWNKAYIVQLSIGKAVVVPLSFDKNIAASALNDTTHKQSIANISKLLMWLDSSNTFHEEVVTGLADTSFINHPSAAFSGAALVEDWNGNPLKKFLYTKGGIFSLKGSGTSTLSNSKYSTPNYNAPPAPQTCYWEDWYVPAYVDGGYTWVYWGPTDLGCYDDDDPPPPSSGVGPSPGDYGTVVSSTGGSGPPPPPPPPDPCSVPAVQNAQNAATAKLNTAGYASTETSLASAAATSGNEEWVGLGANSSGAAVVTTISSGATDNVSHPSTFAGITLTADLHTHVYGLLYQPSPEDVYALGQSRSANAGFVTSYVFGADGSKYALTIANAAAFTAFLQKYSASTNLNPLHPAYWYTGTSIQQDWYLAYNSITNHQQANETAMAYVLDKYNSGLMLLKMGDDKNFHAMQVTVSKDANGNTVYGMQICTSGGLQ